MPRDLEELPPLPEVEEEVEDAPVTRRRRGRPKGRGRQATPGADPRSRGLQKIRHFVEDACLQAVLPPSPMGMVLPVTSQVFLTRGPDFADRVVALCEADQRIFNAMLRASKYGAYLGLASIASTISVAVMVDLGTINRDSFIAQRVVGQELESLGVVRQSGGASSNHSTSGGAVSAAVPTGWNSAQGAGPAS